MNYSRPIHRTNWHAKQVAFLTDLANSIRCTDVIDLPDGTVPDVARWNRERSILLLADAKDTETPGNAATQDRLLGYIAWLVAHASEPKGMSVLILCVRSRSHASSWRAEVDSLTTICGATAGHATVSIFGPGLCVLRWIVQPAWN